jgi:PAS domain S-box-containing protein
MSFTFKPEPTRWPLFLLCTVCFLSQLPCWSWFASAPLLYAQESTSTSVLVLNSYHPGNAWSDDELAGVMRILRSAQPAVALSVEYLDWKRHPTPENEKFLEDVFRYKYGTRRLQVILTLDEAALSFAMRHQDDLFRGTPIVFCGVEKLPDFPYGAEVRATGVLETIDVAGTVDLALQIYPQATTVWVLNDYTESGLKSRESVEALVSTYSDRLRFQFADPLSLEELQSQLANLSAEHFVLSVGFSRDRLGAVPDTREFPQQLTRICPVPIFVVHKDAGLGGSMLAGDIHGEAAARIVLRVLYGEPVTAIPIQQKGPMLQIVEYEQLARFGIPLQRVPAGTVVANRPESFYARHRNLIIGALSFAGLLVVGLVLLARSNLRLHNTKARLAASEERLREIVQNMPVMLDAFDAERSIILWNRECERVTGYSANEVIGNPRAMELLYPDKAYREQMLAEWQSRGDDYLGWEWRLRAKDGTMKTVAWSNISKRFPIEGWVSWGIGVDVTEANRMREEQEQMDRRLQETQKLESLGVLAGGIAHDFNNLLTGILGNASLARLEQKRGTNSGNYLAQIEQAALRAAELCRQMLAYSGRGRFVTRRLDLNVIVTETVNLLNFSVNKKASLRFDLARELPVIQADAAQLRQVIMNLVMNASDAIGQKTGLITVSTGVVHADRAYLASAHPESDLPEGDYVYLEVRDTGCGMSPETQERIFDPFFTTKFTGRGLGLAAVYGIVRGHRGAMLVNSELGRGSTFRLLLPGVPGRSETVVSELSGNGVWRGEGTILVVDDEETVRGVAKQMLEHLGFRVLLADNGRDGLATFECHAHEIAAVVLDLTMPHLDGEETFRELRRRSPDLKILLMSGFNEPEAVHRFAASGPWRFLQKPFKAEQLAEMLRTILTPSTARTSRQS